MDTSMTRDEVDSFLSDQRTVVLATTRADGAPVMHALWFVYLDACVYANIQASSFKLRNIERDARVSCLVEAGEAYFELRGVMLQGTAAVVTDGEEKQRVGRAIEAKGARIGTGLEGLPTSFSQSRRQRLDDGARVLIKVSVDRLRSWDFSKVREHYARASGSS